MSLFTVSDAILVGGQTRTVSVWYFGRIQKEQILQHFLVSLLISFIQKKMRSLPTAQRLKIGYQKSPQVASNFARICIILIARVYIKLTNLVYGHYSLILIAILHENTLNRSAF